MTTRRIQGNSFSTPRFVYPEMERVESFLPWSLFRGVRILHRCSIWHSTPTHPWNGKFVESADFYVSDQSYSSPSVGGFGDDLEASGKSRSEHRFPRPFYGCEG